MFRPRALRSNTFRTGLFSGVVISDKFFIKSIFYMFWFLFSQMNRVKHLLCVIFVNIYHFELKIYQNSIL